jgi:hypothetical protein
MTAQQLAFEFGTTKNAMIGLCRRESIPLTAFANRVHPQGVAAVRHRRKKALAKVVLPVKPKPIALQRGIIPNTDSKPVLESKVKTSCKPIAWPPAHGKCGYIIGEARELTCCGDDTGGRYYCPAHHAACYVPTVRKPTAMYDCSSKQ